MALSDVEISALRSELVHHSSHILDVTKVAITAVTVLIGFGLSRPAPQSALIALLPLLILWPSFTIVRNRRMNVMRIATYLRAYGEEKFQYEVRLRTLRRSDATIQWSSFHRAIARTFVVLGYISIAVSILVLVIDKRWYYLIAPAIATAIWTRFAWKMKQSEPDILMGGKADDEMFEAWRKADLKRRSC